FAPYKSDSRCLHDVGGESIFSSQSSCQASQSACYDNTKCEAISGGALCTVLNRADFAVLGKIFAEPAPDISGTPATVSARDKVCPTVVVNHLDKNTWGNSRGCWRAADD